MAELTDIQIISTILADPDMLDRLPQSALLDLWLLKCRRDPRYKPIKELVRDALGRRIHCVGCLRA